MAVCTAAICDGASAAASSALKSTSGYFAASALANELMAARKPWSATGPENRIRTFFPVAAAPVDDELEVDPLLLLLGVLDVQLVSTTPAATTATAVSSRRRPALYLLVTRTVIGSPGLR
jgi:hypothetical protein